MKKRGRPRAVKTKHRVRDITIQRQFYDTLPPRSDNEYMEELAARIAEKFGHGTG